MSPWTLGLFAGVAVVTLPASASALDTGQCLPAAQVRATLTAESQNPIILGNRTGYGYATALIFTSDTTGSRGYLLRGDKPLGQQADTICIDSVYRDIRLNDITRPGIPAWAMMAVDAARANADCRENRLGYQEDCSPHDLALETMEGRGSRVMFAATGEVINPRDGSRRQNQRITVTISASDQLGGVMATTQVGANYLLSAYSDMSYTQHGEALLLQGR